MFHVHDHAAFDQVCVFNQIGRAQNRSGRDLVCLEMSDRLGDRVPSDPGLDQFVHVGSVFHALLEIHEPGIVRQILAIQRREQALPVLSRHRANRHVAVRGGIDVERHAARMTVATAFGRHAPRHVLHDVGQQEEGSVLHGNVHPLALPGPGAFLQRGQNADHGEQGRGGIADRGAAARRRMVGEAGHAVDAAGRLDDGIVGAPVTPRAVLAEARDRTQDEARVGLAQGRIAEPHLVQRAGRIIFHHHVGPGRQLEEQGSAVRVAQVERDALFVARAVQHHQSDVVLVLPLHTGPAAAGPWRAVAVRLATAGRLHLDDLRTEAAEQQRTVRPGQKTGQVQHDQVLQRLHGFLRLESGGRYPNPSGMRSARLDGPAGEP